MLDQLEHHVHGAPVENHTWQGEATDAEYNVIIHRHVDETMNLYQSLVALKWFL